MPRPGPGRARARFDEHAWTQDLAVATPEARAAADHARAGIERDGAAVAELRRCDAEGDDGTQLPACMKLYVPPPAGPWGVVFQLAQDADGWYLAVIAFGLRHPPAGRRSSVYQVAHRRLHQRA